MGDDRRGGLRGSAVLGWAAALVVGAGVVGVAPGVITAAGLSAGVPVCFDTGAVPGETVVANVTPVGAVAAGFGTLTAPGEDWQASSSVNFVPGAANPNLAIKQPDADGRLCYTADQESDVLVDVVGYLDADVRAANADGSSHRVVDTRSTAALSPGVPVCFDAGARPGETVVVNVTPVNAVVAGFGTLTVPGEDWQASSSVNFGPGVANPNLSIKQPGAGGELCYTADQPSDVLVDVIVYLGAEFRAATTGGGSERVVDTRVTGQLDPAQTTCFATGADADEVVALNITPVGALAAGYGTLTAPGEDWQASSSVNYVEQAANPNFAIKAGDELCYTADQTSDVLIDVVGYIGSGFRPATADGSSERAVDTREDGGGDEQPPSPPEPPAGGECPSAGELEAALAADAGLSAALVLGDGLRDIECAGDWVRAMTDPDPSMFDPAQVYFRIEGTAVVAVDGGTSLTCDEIGIPAGDPGRELCEF